MVVSPGFYFIFSVLVKRLAGKAKMTYFMSNGTLNLNSVMMKPDL